jgi:ABC-type xylose transport system substrate-binding protein
MDWIAALLSSASTCVLLNGSPGDPLSPMLFLLVMEVLNALIRTVDEWNLVEKFGVCAIPYWTAMYALHQAE